MRAMAGLALPLVTLLAASPLGAEDPRGRPSAMMFDIPAQRLDLALSRYSETSGVDVLLDDSDLGAGRSAPVTGRHPPAEALRILLEGTGLVARFTTRNSAIVGRAGRAGPMPGRDVAAEAPLLALDMMQVTAARMIGENRGSGEAQFIARMASRLRQLIGASHLIARRDKPRMRLQTRIHTDGTLYDVRVAVPSPDPRRDAQVIAFLDGAPLGLTPPAALRQPLLFDVDGQ